MWCSAAVTDVVAADMVCVAADAGGVAVLGIDVPQVLVQFAAACAGRGR